MFRKQEEQSAQISMVSAEEAGRSEATMSVDAIPDLDKLTQQVLDFIAYYDDPTTVQLRKDNYPVYLNSLYDKFESMPMSMIKLLSDTENRIENLSKIISLLETLAKVKRGNISLESARDEYAEQQNEAYFYPAFGGKDKMISDIKENGGKI